MTLQKTFTATLGSVKTDKIVEVIKLSEEQNLLMHVAITMQLLSSVLITAL